MEMESDRKRKVMRQAAIRFGLLFPVLGTIFFLSAGTFRYLEAWIYIALLGVPMLFVVTDFARNHPDLLERRMKTKETERPQKIVVAATAVLFLAGFILPGLDRRFGWSMVPMALIGLADMIVLAAYLFVVWVLKTNAYAARVVQVEAKQKVIATGPYAFVRHPMYAGVIVMYLFTPLALGSYWALIPFALSNLFLVPRILNEEKVLAAELEGYKAYMGKVRFRLIPGVW